MTSVPHGVPCAETVLDVRSCELDAFGHVNHAVFLNYLEHARFEALKAAGFPWARLAERGWGIFVVRVEVDYLKEVVLEDRLVIRTWAEGFRRTSMILRQEIAKTTDPATPVSRARVVAVWVGPERRPMRVPDEVRAALSGE